MTIYLGDFAAGETIYIPFHTFNSSGASVTITGLAVTDIEIYKDGSTTQRASDAGYTLLDTDGIDFDGLTGIHGFSVNTGDNTDSGFYAAGSDYWVVVSAITVDSQTVSFVAAIFSIENRSALRPTTAGRTLDVASTGEAGLDFSNVLMPTTGPVHALGIKESGTAQSASSTNLVGRAAATNDLVRPGNIVWAYGSDQGYWQEAMVTAVSGDTFTLTWPVATPSGTITYVVFGTPAVPSSLPVAANMVQIGGDAQSATDLKDFADAGYDPATNKVQGLVLADAVTTVNGLAANVITAASIAADAITAAKIADGAIDAATFAAGAINAAAIATGAIDADSLAADAGTEIAAAVWANTTGALVAGGVISGAAATGTLSTTQATSNLTGYADDQLIGRVIIWTSGACEGEATDITDYASASGLLTFTALTTAPGNGDTFKIV